MYKSEKLLANQLKTLKEMYNIQGIKAEFEAEGSSLVDLYRLRRLCSELNIKLFLKIGGPEAVRDIKESLEIGVDGLIAPMIESKFSAKKFIDAYMRIYQDTLIHTSLNIETVTGVKNIKEILEFSSGKIDNITLGRSDLTNSFFDDIEVESDFIYKIIGNIAPIVNSSNMSLTIGGGITRNTIDKIEGKYNHLIKTISKLETRKVIFNIQDLLTLPESINQALIFEELYILSKKEFSDMMINDEISRLPELNRRIVK